jgi:opacity protein-like surface antigen
MTMGLGIRTWLTGWLGVAVLLAPAGYAWADPELVAGTKDVGIGGAVSISHKTDQRLETVTGYQLLPHVGYFLTDPIGPGLLRGNLEALLEPEFIRLESDSGSASVVGASALARWVFSGVGRFRPYFEAGAGVLFGEMKFRQTNCSVNFLLELGPGVLVSLTDSTMLTAGYRFQHISNAGACEENIGINSSAFYLGVSYVFR